MNLERIRTRIKSVLQPKEAKIEYVALYDDNKLTFGQHLWLKKHAGEVVNLPVQKRLDGTLYVVIPEER